VYFKDRFLELEQTFVALKTALFSGFGRALTYSKRLCTFIYFFNDLNETHSFLTIIVTIITFYVFCCDSITWNQYNRRDNFIILISTYYYANIVLIFFDNELCNLSS